MSDFETLQADQIGEKPFLDTGVNVESFESSLLVNTPPENEKLPWFVGDVVWSKIPGHPWWPSLITHEPDSTIYFKMKGRARYYHVRFYGTEQLRGWVTERNILKYEGKSHFLSLRLLVHGKPHKIVAKQLPAWEVAVKTADKALLLNPHERQVCFNFLAFSALEMPNADTLTGNAFGTLLDSSPTNFTVTAIKRPGDIHSDEPSIKKVKQSSSADVCKLVDPTAKPKNKSPRSKSTKKAVSKQSTSLSNKQAKRVLAKHYNNKIDKQVQNKLDTQIQKQDMNNHVAAVSNTPTSIIQSNINPETGKRKRGRPRKNPVLHVGHNKNEQVVTLPHKPEMQKQLWTNTLPNHLTSPPAENEKSDDTSDTNSMLDLDTEGRKSSSKNKEYVCAVCEKPDNVVICEGICNIAYHKECLAGGIFPDKFICEQCITENHACFACGQKENVVRCSAQNCGKFYHLTCIKTLNIPIKEENFICPLHHCNVCETTKTSISKRRLTCCVRCPVAYHTSTCIVAGSVPLNSQYLVCNRHFVADPKKAHHLHVNVNWCFVCSIGGTLICCESCPAAFHAECIQEAGIPEGRFFCRDCKDGKEMLYGEIVWVKLGMYRWWPAQICNPNNIPANILRMKHQPGEFPVQFLGSHDYYWIHRGRVFSYQEGDKGSIGGGGKYLAGVFKRALQEAQEKHAEWKRAQEEKAEKDLEKLSKKPPVYKSIKVNRYTTATPYEVDVSEWPTCDCSMDDENPCGPESHCLNRILYVECSPLICPAKEKCQNQCFVKREYLDSEPFRAGRRGWGLRAKADGKKGQFVIEYVGELINEETCRERVRRGINEGVINYYMLTIDKDCIIDAGPMGNLSRFMNHSCDPNCETQKWTVNGEVRVGLFAKRDIKVGEELVFDYQLDCLGNEKKKCSCGSTNCSGFLGVRPKTQHALRLQEEKKKNQDSRKKKKKSVNKKNVDEHEDECFDCGDGGKLIMCSKSGCSKCYHLSCLTIEHIPYGDWICPWHFCDDCGKAAMVRCQECSNSFCLAHAPGQITKMTDGRSLCYRHTSDALRNSTPADPNLLSRDLEITSNISVPSGILSVDVPPIPSCVRVDPTETPINPNSVPSNSTSVSLNPTSIPFNFIGDPRNLVNTLESVVNVSLSPAKLNNISDVSTNLNI